MRIIGIDIQNFRKLFGCHIDISKETTLFVGANNSGKTSAMDALAKFLANRSFVFNDITIAKRIDINRIGTKWVEADCEQPADLLDWDTIVPKMDIWLDVAPLCCQHNSYLKMARRKIGSSVSSLTKRCF